MPIYEYLCAACGHELEAMQPISEAPLKQCPSCRKRTLKKMVSAGGFVLKGTGWYVTDFRDKGKPSEEKKEKVEVESGTASKPEEGKKEEVVGAKESKDAKKPAEKPKKKKSASAES